MTTNIVVHTIQDHVFKSNLSKVLLFNTSILLHYKIFETNVNQFLLCQKLLSESLIFLNEVYDLSGLPQRLAEISTKIVAIIICTKSHYIHSEPDFAELSHSSPFVIYALTTCRSMFHEHTASQVSKLQQLV